MTTTSLYVSSAGASARLLELDVVANNLANSDTAGFRADSATFRQTLLGTLGRVGPSGTAPGMNVFTAASGPTTRHHVGDFARTGAPLDAAIDGPGFFTVQTPAGERFTRAGSFHVDRSGVLVSAEGHAVMGEGGPISVGPQPARITPDGQVVGDDGSVLGRLSVTAFEDPSQLRKVGLNHFEAPPLARRQPVASPSLLAGGVEGSNVDSMRELAQLVMLQRAFDASMKVLEADDAASRRLIQEVSS